MTAIVRQTGTHVLVLCPRGTSSQRVRWPSRPAAPLRPRLATGRLTAARKTARAPATKTCHRRKREEESAEREETVMAQMPPTLHGLNALECVSAMQKCIRRAL